MEQEIIRPIDTQLLKDELTPDKQLRMTNKSHNEIYIVTAHDSPNVMKEIGRLRETAFREAASNSSCGTRRKKKSSEGTVTCSGARPT